ncbi:MAG: gamma-glutamyltransferase [Flavobacteriaceae bacterium TMED238]|nr:gamma-glutamyltransferase [Flavobacteriaceae bacterium]RPG61429.1 MAG: gamma-glutamyltransferase [Flavobacteriaceae bacterium TMED238]RZP08353.1 MAG: gamma-glutamyltransferase [Flavobacteriales bacterium]|tara:strand:- start:202 stop:1866 length:1665 start_codon:yes stop_codon:yes gene_type:complete
MLKNYLFYFSVVILLISCENKTYKNGMVVSAKHEASKVGIDILKKGGNAFDAMIATDLALAVVYPNAGNLGGGGFMVYRLSDGKNGTLDFREKAPINSKVDMYLNNDNEVIKGLSQNGALAVGVPGTIAGLFEIHDKFGTIPINELFQPAIDLANNGYRLTKKQVNTINNYKELILKLNDSIESFNKTFKKNDLFINKALAKTLTTISKNGVDEFYKGEIANTLSSYIIEKGGIITKEDFALYKPVWRESLELKYKNLNIITMGPPSSGGIVLGQILQMIENYNLNELGHNSEQYIQLLVEAEKLSFADRSKYLGDPDFNYIPTKELLNKDYLKSRFKSFSFNNAQPSKSISPGELLINESNETTHYSIVDNFGNAVSVTTTLNGNYGSKLISSELGFFLNNEMDDFSIKPGSPNMYGLIGGKTNSIEPEKRMLSSMTPTIVELNGKLSMVLGSPGGPTIITSVLQTLLNFYEFEYDMQESVDASRFHHTWLPDKIFYEKNTFSKMVKDNLLNKGYTLNPNYSTIGRVDAIHIDENKIFYGGEDKRGDDKSIGY